MKKMILKMINRKFIFIISLSFLIITLPFCKVQKDCFSAYRVVIDPGHGGVFHNNKQKYGDKYDAVSGKYLSYFAEGANYKGLYEHKIVYSIAKRVEKLLSYCSEKGDFSKFKKILKKYSKGNCKRIIIETHMSRGVSLTKKSMNKLKDPNAAYRLYDFPDSNGKIVKGRISKINAYKPHLVVSIHHAKSGPPDRIGMNAIVVPPYNVLKEGLVRLKKGKIVQPKSYGKLNWWFKRALGLSNKRVFFEDVVYYFTGFGIKRNYSSNSKDFKGYKQNMVTWAYADEKNWNKEAAKHKKKTKYAEYKSFKEEGKFWEREKSKFEAFRRGSSFKNFGGDNYYASNEIIKYVLSALNKNGIAQKSKIAGSPYISVWSVPLYINAISAYIELGYLDRKWDRKILRKKHNEIAEGIAVGIYSLFSGIKNVRSPKRIRPKGKAINFEKYRINQDKTYFDMVVE